MRLISVHCGVLVLAASALALGQTKSYEAEVATVRERYQKAFAQQSDTEKKALAPAEAAHIREIERIHDDAKTKGNLDAALEAENYLQALRSHEPAPAVKAIDAAVAKSKAQFDRARETALLPYKAARRRLQTEYDQALLAIEQKLTRAGDLESATKVREIRTTEGLIGTWQFVNHADGHRATLEIQRDNTFREGNKRIGTWEIKGPQLIFHHDNRGGHEDRWELPVKSGKLAGKNSLGHSMTLTRD
jgi:hypothetical protein